MLKYRLTHDEPLQQVLRLSLALAKRLYCRPYRTRNEVLKLDLAARSRSSTKTLATLVLAVVSLTSTVSSQEAHGESSDEENRYNVLFIAVDDLRPEIGCYGVDYAQTPNLDRFAARALRFQKHYVSVATCGASRYAMLTGQSPKSSGALGNAAFYRGKTAILEAEQEGAQTMPELFRRSGYTTTLIGKISHTADGEVFAYDGTGDGRAEMPHAWTEALTPTGSWERGWGIFFAYANGRHREDGSGIKKLWEFDVEKDDDLPDGLMATQAIQRLKNYKEQDSRFFMGLGFFKPHLPFVAPKQDWLAFENAEIPLPPEGKIDSPFFSNSGEFYKYDANHKKTRPLPDDAIRNSRRAYLACVRYVDRQIGRVLNTLEQLDLTRNTIIVVWGDHGWHLGEQEIWAKHTPFERANRSVLMIASPKMRTTGKETHSLACSIDIYPTLVELCNPRFRLTHRPLDGKSLVPILRHERARVRDVAVSYWRNAITVRDPRYRYVTNRTLTVKELYDLSENIDSVENLAFKEPETCKRLEVSAGLHE